MTKEYIERESLLELVEHLSKYENCKNCYHLPSCDAWVRNATRLYNDYEYSVEKCPYYIPAADVVPVVHGMWKVIHQTINPFGVELECSNCEQRAIFGNTSAKFCPNCGADMRGVAVNE